MSNPNQCSALGRCSELASEQRRGSALVNSPGKMAMTTNRTTRASGTMNSGLRRSSRQASDHRPAWWSAPSPETAEISDPAPLGATASGIPDPRIEDGVQDVHHQVGNDEDQHQGGDEPDHRRVVLRLHGAEDGLADTGQVEDPLGDDGPGQEAAEVDAEERHHRDERVAHGMDADHPPG